MTTTDARDASAGATPREMSDDTAMDASSASATRDDATSTLETSTSEVPAGEVDGEPRAATATPGERKKKKKKTYERVKLPTPEDVYQQDAMDNCAIKTVMSCVLGGALGGVMGVVFGAFEPMEVPAPDAPKVTMRETIRQGAKSAGARGRGVTRKGSRRSGRCTPGASAWWKRCERSTTWRIARTRGASRVG